MKREFVNSTPDAAAEDDLFAALGYIVKSSEMAEVARKIHQIEMAMENDDNGGGGLSQLANDDTVHYNPSDLSSWLGSMLSGLNPSPEFRSPVDLNFGSDLGSIPGKAVYPYYPSPPPQPPPAKKAKTSPCVAEVSLLVDSQENGINLVHSLMACAKAVQEENFTEAEALVRNVVFFVVSQAGAMRKVATWFAKALAQRIYRLNPMNHGGQGEELQMHFYETCPYLKFAHFTANQAILEAFSGKKRVHVIDFSIKQGMQWPPLIQALAKRNGGAPAFRLTGIGPKSDDGGNQVGISLSKFAETVKLRFDYRFVTASSLAELDASDFEIEEGETLAVNSVLDLHQLLSKPGGIDGVLSLIRRLNPRIFTVAEQEANHNGSVFLDRFNEALHYYSTMFDSLESCGAVADEDKLMSGVYLGNQICNVVAAEGLERVERHEPLSQWRTRFGSFGFKPVHLGSNVYKLATSLLTLYCGDGYTVVENDGCLILGWHTRPIIATSAWTLGSVQSEPDIGSSRWWH